MDQPSITLVMPSFNQARFLRDAILSVLDQRYPHLEFLLLDGGSTDGSAEIIEEFTDELTWWRSHPDDGQASAIREGFDRATGDILCWLNSDDMLADGALARVASAWQDAGGGVIVAGGCQLFGDKSSGRLHVPWFTDVRDEPVLMPVGEILDMGGHWFPGEYYYQPEVFFPAEAYRRVGGVDPRFHYTMDYDLWVRFALAGIPVVIVDDTLAWYREHAEQKTDDRGALYREMVETANGYLDESDLPAARVAWLKAANRAALLPAVRRGRQVAIRAARAARGAGGA